MLAVPLVIGTTPTLAQVSTEGNPQASSQNERRVCRRDQRTGSNVRIRRVCLTESQWRARDQANRERVDDFANRPRGGCWDATGSGTTNCQ